MILKDYINNMDNINRIIIILLGLTVGGMLVAVPMNDYFVPRVDESTSNIYLIVGFVIIILSIYNFFRK